MAAAAAGRLLLLLAFALSSVEPQGQVTGRSSTQQQGSCSAGEGAGCLSPSQSLPYLTIVGCGRNDNYGGSPFVRRLQAWLDVIIHLSSVHPQLPIEVIVVDYNTPAAVPPLSSAVLLPALPSSLSIRFVLLPPHVHASAVAKFGGSKQLQFLEYHAKNAGIRRAKGEYILSTNPDTLLSHTVFEWLSTRPGDPNRFYRAMRAELRLGSPHALSLPADSIAMLNALERLPPVAFEEPPPASVRLNDGRSRLRFMWQLDLDAPGDFMLMHRGAWHWLRGAATEDGHNVHHDTRIACAAAASGLIQVRLPPERYVVYHQAHGREERVERSREAWELGGWASPLRSLISDCRAMLGFGAPMVLNEASWGLAGHEAVTETSFGHVYGHVKPQMYEHVPPKAHEGKRRSRRMLGSAVEDGAASVGDDSDPVISEPLEATRSRCEERAADKQGRGQDVLMHRAWAELMGYLGPSFDLEAGLRALEASPSLLQHAIGRVLQCHVSRSKDGSWRPLIFTESNVTDIEIMDELVAQQFACGDMLLPIDGMRRGWPPCSGTGT